MTLQRAALWAIVVAATMYLLVAGRGLLLPFVLGIVLWYMIDALADAFEHPRFGRLRLPRPLALAAAVCIMGGLLWVDGRTIGRNVSAVIAAAPNYERRLQILINEGARLISVGGATIGDCSIAQPRDTLAHRHGRAGGESAGIVVYAGSGSSSGRYAASRTSWDRVESRNACRLWPTRSTPTSSPYPHQEHARGDHTAWTTGDGSFGVDFAALGGHGVLFYLSDGRLDTRISAPAMLTLVQFDDLTPFLIVLLVFGTIQVVTANVVEPAIMGSTLNLSPLVVIVSLMVWGTIWGVVGMFLCVPITVVSLIVLAQFETTRPIAVLLSSDGRIPEPRR